MSTLKVNTIQDASGNNASTAEQLQQGRAKAWVNFDGTSSGTNKTIRNDFNVSTVDDNGTGDYTINFSTAMANSDYVVTCTTSAQNNFTTAIMGVDITDGSYLTTSIRVQSVRTAANTGVDRDHFNVVIHGD